MVAEALSQLRLALRMCMSWPSHGALTFSVDVLDVSDCLSLEVGLGRPIDLGMLSNDLIFLSNEEST